MKPRNIASWAWHLVVDAVGYLFWLAVILGTIAAVTIGRVIR